MDKQGKILLKELLKEIDEENKEQIKIIFKIFFESYIRSLIIFGITNEITKDTINIYRKIKKIIEEETKIHNFLRKNVKKINEEAVQDILEQLEELNEKTIRYYIEAFEDIMSACDLKNEIYAKHKNKHFKTLIETDEYKILAASLIITYNDIKKILNYEEEFWVYIEDKVIFTNKEETKAHNIEIKTDKNNNIIDFRATIPNITDYETVKTTIEILKYIYYIYRFMINKTENEDIFRLIQEEHIKQYIIKKFN